jgi:hypothetical protein
MRYSSLFALVVIAGGPASAQDAPSDPYASPTETEQPPGPVTSPSQLPPITITITNNNNGNNSNTNTQTNHQAVPVAVTTAIAPPGVVPTVTGPIARYELLPPVVRPQRWITLGVVAGDHDAGIRGSIDLLVRRSWSIGVAATMAGEGPEHEHGDDKPHGSAVAYLAYTTKLGPFDVRAQLGIGAASPARSNDPRSHDATIARSVTGEDDDQEHRGHGDAIPHAEAALLVGLPLTQHLSAFAGPVLSSALDDSARAQEAGGGHDGDHEHGGATASFLGGLSYRF